MIPNHTQKYTVSFDHVLVCLTSQKKKSKAKRINIKADSIKLSKLQSFVNCLNVPELVLYHENLTHLISRFEKTFPKVTAAGGLVKNKLNQNLLIYRRNKWDLPKGKIDHGETPIQAAVREVKEETGVMDLKVKKLLNTSRYIYNENGKQFLKVVYWYQMKTKYQGPLIPETKEQITKVRWKSKSDVLKIPQVKMYQTIYHLIQSS
ncbi:MAG: NUDIX domain-containing protein [Flavobacteriaceae bacterium]|nr:NUDIX domain-containing protein [Flavobacteriaceae bacterium]